MCIFNRSVIMKKYPNQFNCFYLLVLLCCATCYDVCGPALKQLGRYGFDAQYIQSQLPGNGSTVCSGGHCCVPGINDQLISRGRHLIHVALQDGTYRIRKSLGDTMSKFEDSFLEAISNTESKTSYIFQKSFPRLYIHAKGPLGDLFAALKSVSISDPQSDSFQRSLDKFWDDLFPLMFHTTIHTRLPPFAPTYAECLKRQRSSIKPWNQLPTSIGDSLIHALDSVYLMMNTLANANRTIEMVRSYEIPEECGEPAARLYFCSSCHGSDVPPCSGLCLNVARGCFAPMAELDGAWGDLISTAIRIEEAIKSSNVIYYIKVLPDKLSDAIMAAMQSGARLQRMVQSECGPYRHEGTAEFNSRLEVHDVVAVPANINYTLEQRATEVVATLEETRGFWAIMADKTCEPLNTRDTQCWNGLRAADYSRPAVRIGVSAQKYNPEVRIARPSVKIFELAEQLRSVKKVAMKRLNRMPQSYSFQYVEGSGNEERRSRNNDDEDNDEEYAGSGSGDGLDEEPPLVPPAYEPENISDVSRSTKGESCQILYLVILVCLKFTF